MKRAFKATLLVGISWAALSACSSGATQVEVNPACISALNEAESISADAAKLLELWQEQNDTLTHADDWTAGTATSRIEMISGEVKNINDGLSVKADRYKVLSQQCRDSQA